MVSVARGGDATQTSVGRSCGGRAGIGTRVGASSTGAVVVDVFGLGFVAMKD